MEPEVNPPIGSDAITPPPPASGDARAQHIVATLVAAFTAEREIDRVWDALPGETRQRIIDSLTQQASAILG